MNYYLIGFIFLILGSYGVYAGIKGKKFGISSLKFRLIAGGLFVFIAGLVLICIGND